MMDPIAYGLLYFPFLAILAAISIGIIGIVSKKGKVAYWWCISLFGMALVFSNCSLYKHLKLRSKASVQLPDVVQSISFAYIKDLIVVEASLNAETIRNIFIFDTGAFNSKVAYQLAKNLQLETASQLDNGTAQGISRVIEMTLIDSLKIGTVPFFGIAAGKLKYDPQSYSPCIAPDGIIGANLIQLANWKIDYQNQVLFLSEKPLQVEDDSVSHMLEFNTSFLSGIPEIAIQLEGQTIEGVLLDVGYNGGLVVPQAYAKQFPEATSQIIIDQSTSGIYGSNRDTLMIKELTLGLSDFKATIPVEFSSLNKALLGNDFLEHFNLFLDYTHHRIILEPIEAVRIEKARTFIPGILNDSMWIVNRTQPASPLNIGDTLSTINGLSPSAAFSSHCEYFLDSNQLLREDQLMVETLNHQTFSITTK